MRRLTCLLLLAATGSPTMAHFPHRETKPVHPRYDVIGPVGNCLPPSYRRVYNRPTWLGGKIAHMIAPSSQEAMAWHNAEHMGLYDEHHHPRVEQHYFFPKPWEALKVGARRPVDEPAPAGEDEGMLDNAEPQIETTEIDQSGSPTEITEDPDTLSDEPASLDAPQPRPVDELPRPDEQPLDPEEPVLPLQDPSAGLDDQSRTIGPSHPVVVGSIQLQAADGQASPPTLELVPVSK